MENIDFLNSWSIEQRITHHLILNAISCEDLGLLHGKMGIVIAFYQLGRKTRNKIYSAFADDLLDRIINRLHRETDICFESGLLGIGWGLEFLIQNQFIEANSLEICEDIDSVIMEKDIRRITNHSLEKGLLGFLHYIVIHTKGCINQGNKNPFDKMYFTDLYDLVKSIKSDNKKLAKMIITFTRFIETGTIKYDAKLSDISHRLTKVNHNKINKYPVGIQKGLASFII